MAIVIKGANTLVTYLNQPTFVPMFVPTGTYYISSIAQAQGKYVGISVLGDGKLPIVISESQSVSPNLLPRPILTT